MRERRQNAGPTAAERRASGRDRRVAQRYTTGGTSIVLSWEEGGLFRSVTARLRDISLSGGSALAEEMPPKGIPIWFRLSGDQASDWIGTAIVGVSKTGLLGRGPRLIRMRFLSACPYQVFKAAIEGFSQHVEVDEPKMGVYTRRDWR